MSERLDEILKKIDSSDELSKGDLEYILSIHEDDEMDRLFRKAYQIKTHFVGRKIYLRGIIEFSNICEKDCYYCGIRKSNAKMKRFSLARSEILEAAKFAFDSAYASLVLQSGERSDIAFVEFVEDILKDIKMLSGNKLGITLCVGEESEETYRRWFAAGAHRYLLRIESSNRELYKKIHPEGHSFERRVECLKMLKKIGYQVGTGVLIGFPGQSNSDLADDIIFFKEIDADMIGMGPYIVHHETPLAKKIVKYDEDEQFKLGLRMIAATRLYLKDINIASTTALQALNPYGRELGLLAGANVIMPNITGTEHRVAYQLYENKPCLDENAHTSRVSLQRKIEAIGETIGFNEWGDSPHYKKLR